MPAATPTSTWLPISLFISALSLYYSSNSIPSSKWPVIPYMSISMIVLVLFIAALVIIAVRATVVTWITVLVLLAFAGNRRKVLVRQGSNITADITMSVMKTVFKERSLLAIAFLVLTFIVHIQRG
ncbi:hypothetical protein AQUCO_01100506v1 [Aquilegia coerulea]|uniref:Uncharacterized protein n=1 Tax=Aquilegia coerulea TaxID=218851 RepID=A0A2G5E7G2_AQUCA|nr:hypothetical protein AQUCO_01100506v1 [Aquilegia coerulea]